MLVGTTYPLPASCSCRLKRCALRILNLPCAVALLRNPHVPPGFVALPQPHSSHVQYFNMTKLSRHKQLQDTDHALAVSCRGARQGRLLPADNMLQQLNTQESSHARLACVQRRNTTKSSREKQNREEEKLVTVAGPKGDTEWERTIDYINFGEQCLGGPVSEAARMCAALAED